MTRVEQWASGFAARYGTEQVPSDVLLEAGFPTGMRVEATRGRGDFVQLKPLLSEGWYFEAWTTKLHGEAVVTTWHSSDPWYPMVEFLQVVQALVTLSEVLFPLCCEQEGV